MINLNYFEFKNYFDLYLNNNKILNEIIINNNNSYNFQEVINFGLKYNILTEYSNIINYEIDYLNENFYQISNENIINKCIYEKYNLIFMLNSIINRKIIGYCIKTNKEYECDKISYYNIHHGFAYSTMGYHFNSDNNEFIILFIWEFYNPILIYYPNTQEIYNISYRYKEDFVLNIFNATLLNPILNNYIINQKKEITYSIGLVPNAGHHFWNEICGFLFLIENNLLDNIDKFIIYENDYLNTYEILKFKFKKDVERKKSNNLTSLENININVSKTYITQNICNLFKNIYLNVNNNININNHEINILFDIRTNSRVCLNEKESIIFLINETIKKYNNYTINFYITGWYFFEDNEENNLNDNVIQQNNIINEIQSNFSFKINNLVGLKLIDILNICQNIDIIIANLGSGINFFSSIIFNTITIGYTNTITYGFFNQILFINNLINIIPLEINNITFIDNNNFSINIHELNNLLVNQINILLKNKLNMNNV